MTEARNVVIIGGGPAGLTAGLYSARALLNPLVLEGELLSNSEQPGGQLMTTTEVENFPGFPDAIYGPELINLMRKQAIKFGAQVEQRRVVSVNFHNRPFELTCSDGSSVLAHSVIIATGAKALLLNVEGEEALLGHGVSTCATCDGFFFKDKTIGVVGGGDSAIEEALFLTRYAASVTVIHRRDRLRASKVMQERAFSNPKISFLWNKQVVKICGKTSVEWVELIDTLTKESSTLELNGLFIAIGHEPQTQIFKEQLKLDDRGYILTYQGTQTSVEGVFACGDVIDSRYRQAITAAGSGCQAAIDSQHFLENLAHSS